MSMFFMSVALNDKNSCDHGADCYAMSAMFPSLLDKAYDVQVDWLQSCTCSTQKAPRSTGQPVDSGTRERLR